MPAMKPAPRKRPSDAIERLYVYWIISTVLLLFAVIVSTVYTRGALYGQAEQFNQALRERDARLADLEIVVAQLESNPTAMPAGPTAAAPGQPSSRVRAEESGAGSDPAAPAGATPPPVETPSPFAAIPPESEIQTGLDRVLGAGTIAPYAVQDVSAARDLLALAFRHASRADWSGATWSRLAVLARLMSQGVASDAFARRADQANDPLITYADVSTRALLAAGRAQDALIYAEHFAECTNSSPVALVLLARTCLALGDAATADGLLAAIDSEAGLASYDRLALARACLELQRWDRLAEVMATVPAVPSELDAERNFLQAVVLIQRDEQLAEALGILNYLADRDQSPRTPATNDEPPLMVPPVPDDYEIGTWRGVALMRGNQVESARRVLDDAARQRADRPDAYYWRAMLEIRQGRTDTACDYLQNALATSARFAPAWEALGQIALNAGDLGSALDNLEKAIEANERRASAHFLVAVTYAKASQSEPAAEALKAAFLLDPGYVETARQTEVLTRLFTSEGLEQLAADAEPPPADEAEGVAP